MSDNVLQFIRQKDSEPTDVKMLLEEALASDYEKVITLGLDKEGYWCYQCSREINRVLMMGMLELLKLDIYKGMCAKEEEL